MTPQDIAQLRTDWPIDDGHKATRNTNHCDQCYQRMPCDWSSIVTDLHNTLDTLATHLETDEPCETRSNN